MNGYDSRRAVRERLTALERVARQQPLRLGTERIEALLAQLDHPENAMPRILVAGTNGKGSTAAFLTSILRTAGLRVGTFLSPPLGEDRLSIAVDGVAIAESSFSRLLLDVLEVAARRAIAISSFEALSAVALVHCAQEQVDVAVIEAGLGGSRDTTNVGEPMLSAMVSIAEDHLSLIGPELEDVVREKAGVFRAGRPAVIGWLPDHLERLAAHLAAQLGAHPVLARHRVDIHVESAATPSKTTISTNSNRYQLDVPLAGAHQVRNAALAVLCAEELQSTFNSLNAKSIEQGIATTRLPGRLEWIRGESLVLLDIAHNPAAIATVVDYLRTSDLRCNLLFGAFADKDARHMLRLLEPYVGRVYLTSLNHARSWQPESENRWILEVLQTGQQSHRVESFDDPILCLEHALIDTSIPLLVTGSAFLVGCLRSHLLGGTRQ